MFRRRLIRSVLTWREHSAACLTEQGCNAEAIGAHCHPRHSSLRSSWGLSGDIMDSNPTERRDFIPYPMNRVVGTVADAGAAHAAIEALLQAGFAREDIDLLHGEAGAQRLDPEGIDHGFLAQFQRTLMRTGGQNEEYRHLMRHAEDVSAGRFVLMVLARRREQRTIAADVLNTHGAEFV